MVNDKTLDLITEYEGFVDHWYADPAHGWSIPTCCYGHTDMAGAPFFANTRDKKFTEAEGREILLKDLVNYEHAVDSLVRVPLNENQRGALVSFTFNLGKGNLEYSTLLKKLNKSDYLGASKEFGKWVYANNKKLRGLVRRREAERVLFVTPVPGNEETKDRTTLIDLIFKFLKLLFGRKS